MTYMSWRTVNLFHFWHCRDSGEMAEPTNFTEYLTEKMIRDLYCSKRFTAGQVHNELIFLSVLNTLLATSAFLGNTLILVALRKESSLHPPFKLMYCNLAITDLCVGIVAEPLCVVYFMSVVNETWDVCLNTHLILAITGTILCAESLVTVAAISVDRLLALSLGLRYRQVITLKRAYTAVIGYVGFVHCLHIKLLLESSYISIFCPHNDSSLPADLRVFVHKNNLYSAP